MGAAMKDWTAGDIMATEVVTVSVHTPYKEVVDLLAKHGISALPVVDERSHVLGVVSEADVLRKIEFLGDEHERRILDSPSRRAARAKAHGATAGDLMSAPAITIEARTPVVAVAKLLDAERVKRLPVVDADGRLRGIVSRRDLMKMYLRPDSEIQDEIAHDVLVGMLWLDPSTVHTRVADGVVRLAGSVDRHSAAELAGRLSGAVPGVVTVVNELTWRYDDIASASSRFYRSHPFSSSDR